MNGRLTFAIVLSAIFLTGCERWTGAVSATEQPEAEAETCRQIGARLPTRSRSDTEQTIEEIGVLYASFALACPEFEHLVPQ
jgi:PBP1b-binding outer membrane lipoprotein LpoB